MNPHVEQSMDTSVAAVAKAAAEMVLGSLGAGETVLPSMHSNQ